MLSVLEENERTTIQTTHLEKKATTFLLMLVGYHHVNRKPPVFVCFVLFVCVYASDNPPLTKPIARATPPSCSSSRTHQQASFRHPYAPFRSIGGEPCRSFRLKRVNFLERKCHVNNSHHLIPSNKPSTLRVGRERGGEGMIVCRQKNEIKYGHTKGDSRRRKWPCVFLTLHNVTAICEKWGSRLAGNKGYVAHRIYLVIFVPTSHSRLGRGKTREYSELSRELILDEFELVWAGNSTIRPLAQ